VESRPWKRERKEKSVENGDGGIEEDIVSSRFRDERKGKRKNGRQLMGQEEGKRRRSEDRRSTQE